MPVLPGSALPGRMAIATLPAKIAPIAGEGALSSCRNVMTLQEEASYDLHAWNLS